MADNGNNDNVFIYMGRRSKSVSRMSLNAIVDRSVDTIPARAFRRCYYLVSIEMHDGCENN